MLAFSEKMREHMTESLQIIEFIEPWKELSTFNKYIDQVKDWNIKIEDYI